MTEAVSPAPSPVPSAARPEAAITLTLEHSVAVVLLDMLGRMDESGAEPVLPPFEHASERVAMWVLRSALEGAVGEDLAGDYDAALDAAHRAVVSDLGEK